MDLIALYPLLKTAWVVWFFVLFGFILIWVLRPGKRQSYEALASIPLRDEAPRPRQPERSI
ncbi:cbb3-type cytochrome oxidase subunit 3 [Pseudoroseomonas cervicalis]|uniref:Cytochrome c oxidase, cbb3-type, CcoQ subunit n=1 Tax=Pseudoroseomonas cervicalis ATCC 49957 TaxID=525371 RepID=D5RSX3_9PROT|nr:cbb3-type cytochrome c oxidase subunit 3 [Pseudoroseomonas cervicalis]EFH09597.1 cytochrome c oxidase, cbb3-type, CcoQ subunit [Pseudoroseomonas cervicalis ATCC 49957]